MNIAVKEKREVGRPSKWETHVKPRLEEILQWLKDGMTEYSIADQLSIGKDAWIEYKDSYSELAEVITRARMERNRLTYNSMHRKANGITVKINKQKVLNDGTIVSYTEEQYIPPDVNAADLDLRNNDPEYKSAKSEGLTIVTNNNLQLPQLEQELKQIAEQKRAIEMQLNQGTWEAKEL